MSKSTRNEDMLREMYDYYFYSCFVTRQQATQRAHIIGNTKPNRRKYGDEVVDHPANWLPVADLQNNALVDLGSNESAKALVAEIIQTPNQTLHAKRKIINVIVLENIQRKKAKL